MGHDGQVAGRRPGSPDTRQQIAQAAGTLFASVGYDRTTIRSIADAAGVDSRLVTHYFGSKQQLFVAITKPPVPATEIAHLLSGQNPSEAVAKSIATRLGDPAHVQTLAGLLRAATSSDKAAEQMADLLTREIVGPVSGILNKEDADLRIQALAAVIAGMVFSRNVLKFEDLRNADTDKLERILVPIIERLLFGDS